eukprot:gnl/MRDRNA2_/MRDRNA2_36551_c0_seq1.p1 gnl/MRDRNA2_/MRDRNA2_36551_c0~~gnl/MRDRNA2_/MRDRNA2_36551_c0_seq1.p1  ORF type:complete len:140 (-),score=53.30 gnl/MRDRNA2_/MRDRNA2_36551_c0_seq1:336-755(-)
MGKNRNQGKKGAGKGGKSSPAAKPAEAPKVVPPPSQPAAAPEPAPAPQVVKPPAPEPKVEEPATPEPPKKVSEPDVASGPPVAQEAKDEKKELEQVPWFAVPFAFIGDRFRGVPLGMTFQEHQEKKLLMEAGTPIAVAA